ncbi:DUF4190 domain-containing protein [Pirellulales bacterium]|nr:DUF4190 domain-containing protein [Pirellulales bacterium]
MSVSAVEPTRSQKSPGEAFQYRSVSLGAVVALVLGVGSSLILLAGRNSLLSAVMIAPLPLAGIALGAVAFHRIRRDPEYLSGLGLAAAGIALSSTFLMGGLAYAGYVFATEVPDGYHRSSFIQFAPDLAESNAGVPVPEDVLALDGQKVFLKGFIRPDSVPYEQGFREFLLVRDNNECCYGDQAKVKYYDQVAVDVVDGLKTSYSSAMLRVGGTLHVLPNNLRRGPGHPVFKLEADYLK